MKDKSGAILTHITREHDKPNVFETDTHPKTSGCYQNGEKSGRDAS